MRLEEDGTLTFLGRVDRQVKLRGFRIEPGETEAALAARPGVARALAAVRSDALGERRLLAWVVPSPTAPGSTSPAPAPRPAAPAARPPGARADHRDRRAAADRQRQGRLGRPAGPAAAPPRPAKAPRAPLPRGEAAVRRELAAIWAALLGRAEVGLDASFFDVGGHSLLVVKLQERLAERFGVELPIGELFAHPTLRRLAERLQQALPAPEAAPERPRDRPRDRSRDRPRDGWGGRRLHAMRPLDELFAELARLGVGLEAEGGALRVRGPAGSIEPALRAELAARKAELLQALAGTEAPALAARPDSDAPAPLTFNQRRLWFLEKLGESGSSFAMTAAWELTGALDVAALHRALGALTRRHAILRARVEEPEDEQDGEPRLAIAPWAPPALEEESAGADAVQALLEAEAAAPFDLARGPLFRVRLVRLAEDRRLLLVGLHHLISDRWSMGILFRDLAALMRAELTGEPAGLPALPLQFADFAAWQRGRLTEATLAPELGLVEAAARRRRQRPRPAARPAPAAGARQQAARPTASTCRPRPTSTRLAARHGATAFMAYLAVYAALLARWGGQDELVVGCPLGSRDARPGPMS